jgi:hypothetical protein
MKEELRTVCVVDVPSIHVHVHVSRVEPRLGCSLIDCVGVGKKKVGVQVEMFRDILSTIAVYCVLSLKII